MASLEKVNKALTFAMAFKAAVGCSVATLALFGVAVPHLGIEPTIVQEGAAAGAGAIMGLVLAIKG